MTPNLLRQDLERERIVKKLSLAKTPSYIDDNTLNGRVFLQMEPSAKLEGMLNPLIVVPGTIDIFQTTKQYRNRGVILFASRKGDSTAYVSLVVPGRRTPTGTNYRNVWNLAYQPWFGSNHSHDIYYGFWKDEDKIVLDVKKRNIGSHPLFPTGA